MISRSICSPIGFGEHFAAVLRGELRGGLPLAREVGGDEHAEIVLGHQEYAVHVGILDLNAVAFAQMRDELPPGGTEIDEDDENRQRPVSRCCDVERFPDLAVHTVGGDQKVCPDRLVLAGIQITQHRGDAGVILFERTQLRPVAHFAATPPCFGEQHRLEAALRAVLHGRLGAQLIQAGEKRVDVDGQPFFRTVQCRLDHHVGNSVGDGVDLVAQAQTAQDLQAAKAEISGLRVNENLAPLFHQQ